MSWIKLDRGILDSGIWNDSEPFNKRAAWIDLLLLANYEDTEQIVGYEVVKVPRGSLLVTNRELADRWHWSNAKVAQFLLFLTSQGMIRKNANTKRTLLTIEKYSDYQDGVNTKRTRSEHGANTERTQDVNLLYKERNKEDKKLRNRGAQSARFIPPTVDEVRAYCQERTNEVSPEAFINFYESKGWMVGKNKMKDWKAAVRTWETSQRSAKKDTRTMSQRFEEMAARLGEEVPDEQYRSSEVVNDDPARISERPAAV